MAVPPVVIADVLGRGDFAGVTLGDAAVAVRTRWGEPEKTARLAAGIQLWRYGDVELQLAGDVVWFLALAFAAGRDTGHGLAGTPWTAETPLAAVRSSLSRAGFDAEPVPELTFDRQLTLVCRGSAAHVAFADERLVRLYLAGALG